jgi:hypothetical protein
MRVLEGECTASRILLCGVIIVLQLRPISLLLLAVTFIEEKPQNLIVPLDKVEQEHGVFAAYYANRSL